MYRGQLIFFCGAGGTGKTQLAQAVSESLKCQRFASPTRDFYKLKEIESEEQLFTKPEEFRKQFQKDLFTFYLKKIEEYTFGENDWTVFERSPFCNLAYLLYHNTDFSLQQIEQNFDRAVGSIVDTVNKGWVPVVVLFPYPTSWILEGKNKDKFRHTIGRKDVIVHSLMQYFCWRAYKDYGIGVIELVEDTTQNWLEIIKESIFTSNISK